MLNHPADRSDTSTQYQMMERLTGTLERVRQLRDSPRLNDHVKNAAIEAYEAGKLAAEKGAALALAMDTFDRAIIDIAPDSASRYTNPESYEAVMRMERRRTAMEEKLLSTIERLSGVYTDLVETNATVTASGIVGAGQEQLEAISESLAELRDLVDRMEEGDLPQIDGGA